MELRKTLANGVEVIASTNPHLHSFCAAVRIRAGSAYEAPEENGITHLMEHCIVRSLKGRFREDFYTCMSRGGISFDPFTRTTNTEYRVSGSPRGIPLAVEIIRKMFLPITLSDRDFQVEKDRVLAEMGADNRDHFTAYLEKTIQEPSPASLPVLGTADKVARFTQERLNAHMQSILVPENVQFCLTGCIDEAGLALLLEAAEAIPMFAGTPAPKELPLPKDFGKRGLALNCRAEVDYLRYVFDVDPGQWPRAVLDLVQEILFNGLDALLYQELSEKTGLVYSFQWPYLQYRNWSTLEFCFYFDGIRLLPTLQAVSRTMELLQMGAFDLESKKNALRTRWEMTLDDPAALNGAILHNLYLTDSPEPPDWDRVTKEEIIACARAVFESGILGIWHREEWAEIAKILNQVGELEA